MATSTARPSGTAGAAAPGAEEMLTTLARVVARLAVKSSASTGVATFRQIAVLELKIATEAEAEAIDAWLRAHPPGS